MRRSVDARDPVAALRAEIRALERGIQREAEKSEYYRILRSAAESREKDLSAQLVKKRDELRKATESSAQSQQLQQQQLSPPQQQQQQQQPNRATASSPQPQASPRPVPGPTDARAKSLFATISQLSHLKDHIPTLPVAVASKSKHGTTLSGPKDEDVITWFDQVAARTVSSYPTLRTGKKLGSPIADSFCVEITAGRYLLCLADGCSWGERALSASRKASSTFAAHLAQQHEDRILVVRDAAPLLLEALAQAHSEVIGNRELWECGTTTILGGALIPLQTRGSTSAPPRSLQLRRSSSANSFCALRCAREPTERKPAVADNNKFAAARTPRSSGRPVSGMPKLIGPGVPGEPEDWEWAFVFVSCGDCKAFHWNAKTHRVTDITAGNRLNVTDPTDPGGRIGPHMDNGMPDLRNLRTYMHPCSHNDLIVVCSDGVHDNFDPPSLGIDPGDLSDELRGLSWDAAAEQNRELVDELRQAFMEARLELIINDLVGKRLSTDSSKPVLPLNVTNAVVEYCLRITSATRSYMEENPLKNQPTNMKEFPGKMDHTTCVTIRVDHPVDYTDFS